MRRPRGLADRASAVVAGQARPPARPGPGAPAPGRLSAHRKIERGPGIALPFRLLMAIAVIALSGGVLLVANGGLGKVAAVVGTTFDGFVTDITRTPAPSAPEPV